MKRNCRYVYSGNLKRRGGSGAQWIISLSLTPELILVLVTETHLQDRTNCLSSQHAFLQAGPHFYRASSHYQMLSSKISAIQKEFFTRTKHQLFKPKARCVCVGLYENSWSVLSLRHVKFTLSMFFWAKTLGLKPDE